MIFKVLPLSLYIHFPWCLRKCPYCDFNSYPQPLDSAAFVNYSNAIITDLEHDFDQLPSKELRSIYLGGGTPTLFAAKYLDKILDLIYEKFSLAADLEITIEANPGTIDLKGMQELRQLGINRISLGVQSFNDKFLQALGRVHNSKQTASAIAAIIQAGFTNYNIDLMFGLPKQTIAEAVADLQLAIQFLPQHVSWYQLTLEPETPMQQQAPILPDHDLLWEMTEIGEQYLAAAGFAHYEVAAFARSGFNCKHNINYWEFGDYLGVGAGAHSKLTVADKILRRWKIAVPEQYLSSRNFVAGENTVTAAELPFEFMLNALRLYQPIPIQLFIERTGLDIATIAPKLQMAQDLNLLALSETHLTVTPKGRQFLNDLVGLFL